MKNKYKKFMIESNAIEGEKGLNPSDIEAVKFAVSGIKNLNNILSLHFMLGKHLNEPWVGKFRKCRVFVGDYKPPSPEKVPILMQKYVETLKDMNSWEAHNKFEKIHPFVDLNGRVGRLIWLSKAIHEGYNFKIPFLHEYYYQTLEVYQK